ncbi:hypothetical protein [Corynebacterium cystitidis]|uniref:hypothetical protein n=1 Tax=Corynebacterium cystitidis TaxID=35757 RepID=UPI00211DD27D|nr:hypothetical protein [Corynebacterium cystitidis]
MTDIGRRFREMSELVAKADAFADEFALFVKDANPEAFEVMQSYFDVGEVEHPVAMAVQSCIRRGVTIPDRLAEGLRMYFPDAAEELPASQAS